MNKVKFIILAASLGFALTFCEEKSSSKLNNNSDGGSPSVDVFDSAQFSDWAQKVSANISGINLGDNIRNDIEWRKKWVAQLKETEETFSKIINSAAPPYTLYYSTAIETKNINYQNETADLVIPIYLFANLEWFNKMQQSLKVAQAVMDGLNATNRKNDWGLGGWPLKGVSNATPFGFVKQFNIPVVFELVNQKGKVIGKQTVKLYSSFYIDGTSIFTVEFTPRTSFILTFNAVNANDISDNLTIRLASVNGASPKNARFSITAISTKVPSQNSIKRTTFTDSRDGKKYKVVEIGGQIWMAENLNYATESSKCYKNDPANCQLYGMLYDWNTATKVCPKGWHLPSDSEWQALEDFAGGPSTAGIKLKATSGWKICNEVGTDEFDFSALPGGKNTAGGIISGVSEYGYWWSATEYKFNISNAYSRHMRYCEVYSGERDKRYYSTRVNRDYDNKMDFYSVRCVQD